MNKNPFISSAGVWIPVNQNQLSATFNGGIAFGFQGLIKIGNSSQYSLLVTGWNASGLDYSGQTIKVNVGLFTPNSTGDLVLSTTQHIGDPITNGSGSVVIADFDGDGLEDIFLAAHSENPFLPAASTAYMQKKDGSFTKIALSDQIVAHDAELVNINGIPMVATSTFNATNEKLFASANPIYFYDGTTFKTLAPTESWYDIARKGDGSATWLANGGMSTVVDKFKANGDSLIIRGDNSTYSNDWSKQLSMDIAVYSFGATGQNSTIAVQRITPYLSTLKQYENYDSLWGKGITHVYRVWSEDFNHDGSKDLIAAQSMWNPVKSDWPNALQFLRNDGTGTFYDQTAKLNSGMSLNT